jgi:hypothetical protein
MANVWKQWALESLGATQGSESGVIIHQNQVYTVAKLVGLACSLVIEVSDALGSKGEQPQAEDEDRQLHPRRRKYVCYCVLVVSLAPVTTVVLASVKEGYGTGDTFNEFSACCSNHPELAMLSMIW